MMRAEFARFLIVGATNTAFSYLVFLLLYKVMHYQAAYALSYAAGVVLSYFLNVHFVFKTKRSLKSFLRFPFVYVVQYGLGALMLGLLVGWGADPRLAMAAVIVITIPVTFVASRFVLKR
jgi:putative flippase GtrA